MIAHLKGIVLNKQKKTLVLDVNGVGYLVHATANLLDEINEADNLNLFIFTNVREDDISLYGFLTQEEWDFFKLVLTVSGIGPKSAMEILNAPLQKVRQAIAQKESAFLTGIPGIGRKTAERMIIDLEGKIKEDLLEEKFEMHGEKEDIVQALISLGYQRKQVVQGLKKIPAELVSEEEIIKFFLQNT